MTEQTYEKIDPEFKEKWVAALRSGEYEQTTGTLRRVNSAGSTSHCCLGVACDLLDSTEWAVPDPEDFDLEEDDEYWEAELGWRRFGSDEITSLPFASDPAGQELAFLNDQRKMSFGEIATWIEENL